MSDENQRHDVQGTWNSSDSTMLFSLLSTEQPEHFYKNKTSSMRHTLNIPEKSQHKILPPLIGVKITFLWCKPYPLIQYVLPRSNRRSLWKSSIIEQLLRWEKTGLGIIRFRGTITKLLILFLVQEYQ